MKYFDLRFKEVVIAIIHDRKRGGTERIGVYGKMMSKKDNM
jgi:hypothetical protein